jgi:hypothetical protein
VDQPLETIRSWSEPWRSGLWSLHIRAYHDAIEYAGRDVLVSALTGLVAGLSLGLATRKWGLAAIVGVGAPFAVLVGFYALHFVLNCVRGHKGWEPRIGQAGDKLLFELQSKIGAQMVNGVACEVRHPNGARLRAVDPKTGPTDQIWFQYPGSDFGDGPAVAIGRYEATWFEHTRRGRWRQILRHKGTIKF